MLHVSFSISMPSPIGVLQAVSGRLFTITAQMRQLPSGKFAMCAGDFNGDGKINDTDYQGYLQESSSINGYLPSDFNLDKHTSTTDFNLMLNNSGAIGVDWIRYD